MRGIINSKTTEEVSGGIGEGIGSGSSCATKTGGISGFGNG